LAVRSIVGNAFMHSEKDQGGRKALLRKMF